MLILTVTFLMFAVFVAMHWSTPVPIHVPQMVLGYVVVAAAYISMHYTYDRFHSPAETILGALLTASMLSFIIAAERNEDKPAEAKPKKRKEKPRPAE